MRSSFAKFANLFRKPSAERDLSREIECHLALLQDDFESKGLSPQDARLAARRSYGGVEQAKELHRDARSFVWVEQRYKDLLFGARYLSRNPGFAFIAILTLGLGLGANTAIFGVVNAVLLRPLAYKDADRLVTLLHDGTDPVATANYIDWRDQSNSFEAMGGADYWSPNLTNTDPPEHLYALKVTQNLLPMLGVEPMLGRLFVKGEDQEGNDHEVILSEKLWQRRFHRDPSLLGKSITLNGEAYTVVGVMPPEFKFAPFWATHAELWIPNAFGDSIHNRGGNHLRVFARLKPGVTLAQARADVAIVTGRLEKQFPGTNRRVVVTPLKENVVGKIQAPLFLVLGAVGFVFLIACGNVAHMLLARTADREKEIAVRTALGAGRARVTLQFLTENLLLAVLGSVAGLLLASWVTRALVLLSPAYIPRVDSVNIDRNVILFLIAATVLMAAIFGLVPAMHSAAGDLNNALKEGGRGSSDSTRRNRVRSLLVISEFALAFILLIGAGLMIRSFVALQRVDPGFNPHNVLSMVVSVAGSREAEAGQRLIFYRQLLEKIRALPGVESVGAINHLPLAGDQWGTSFRLEGRPKPAPGESPAAVYRLVMPGYFSTMRLPIRRGRDITAQDDSRAPDVVIINQRAANVYWPAQDPVGKRITLDGDVKSPTWLTIVGVAANAKQMDWTAEPFPELYLSAPQNHDLMTARAAHFAYITLVVRTAGNPTSLVSAVKEAVWSFDRNLPVSEVVTMDGAVADATALPRFEMLLLGAFGAVALLLAAIGIYGVLSYSVLRRKREIAIRMSVGASRADVVRMVVQQGLRQASFGAAIGIFGALALSRLMAKMLFGVQPTDPVTFAMVGLVLGIAALLAIGIPARQAMLIEPMVALRNE